MFWPAMPKLVASSTYAVVMPPEGVTVTLPGTKTRPAGRASVTTTPGVTPSITESVSS